MKTTRKVLILMLAAFLALYVPWGCGSNDNRVAFFIYDENDTFLSELMAEMDRLIPPGIATDVRYAGNSQAVQNQQILEIAKSGVKLFVINAVDRLACHSIVEMCLDRGIDVIFFNREPLEDAMKGENIYYVGAAANNLGEMQAEMVDALFGGYFVGGPYDKNRDGVVQLAIIKGEQGHQDAEKRTDNCVSRLRDLGLEAEVLGIEVANWNRKNAYEAMERLYAQHGELIELLFANNDDMALGAIDYLLEAGIFSPSAGTAGQPFVVVGVDGTAVGLDMIGRGLLYGTVLNDSAKQADAIVRLIQHLINGVEISDFPYEITNGHYVYIDGETITQANLSQYTQ